MKFAWSLRMGVKRFQDLVCWQLSTELKRGIYALIDRTGAKRDFKFRDQIMESSASAPSNIAEGFGSYGHRESARYARIAKSSLTESQNHLLDGIDRRHWTTTDVEPSCSYPDARSVRRSSGLPTSRKLERPALLDRLAPEHLGTLAPRHLGTYSNRRA
jgi:four helix bundle protein